MNRHFKIYYLYWLGRFFDILKCYERASKAYSEVFRYRYFFLDAESRFINSYKKTAKDFSLVIQGGLGDILQHLPFMIKNKKSKYLITTHFLEAKDFLDQLNIRNATYFFYTNLTEFSNIKNEINQIHHKIYCPRQIFFNKNPFFISKKLFTNKNKIIGIHGYSSKLAPNKGLPNIFLENLIDQLIQKKFNVIFFCTADEIKQVRFRSSPFLKCIANKNVSESLSLVSFCDAFIGSDSAFKTMSSMLKIPTIVIHADDKNHFRDRNFINPYMKNNIMTVFKYKKLNSVGMNKALNFTLEHIQKLLN